MMLVENWMLKNPIKLFEEQTLREAIALFSDNDLHALSVVDGLNRLTGSLSKDEVLKALVNGADLETPIVSLMNKAPLTVPIGTPINKIEVDSRRDFWPVVDEEGKLAGVVSLHDKLRALATEKDEIKGKLEEAEHMLETLKMVLDTAYEGVVVVDSEGIILEFNKAYSQFIGVEREEALGKHVTEVIENTKMHIVADTGIPERGHIQTILGQSMVVHRMPIWRDGKIAGAVGMLIFQGVSEVYNILNRLQDLSRNKSENKPSYIPGPHQEKKETNFDGIIGRSPQISKIKSLAARAARVPATILITGESGTGKEVFSKYIHRASPYREGNFVSVNCAAIPEHLLEAELFGYEDGSFTGAKKGGKLGKVELANKGTLFLDEIGDMPLYMQAKILRVLEERVVERVGGLKPVNVDVRILAATNKDLEEMVKKGTFREDLFFRLNIIRIHLPSLRERKSDIPHLTAYHMERICREYHIEKKELTKDAMDIFMNYSWPGNVRELVNTLQMLMGLVDGPVVKTMHLPKHFFNEGAKQIEIFNNRVHNPQEDSKDHFDWRGVVYEKEKKIIQEALIEEKGNKAAVARKLGIHRSTLYEKLKKYKLV